MRLFLLIFGMFLLAFIQAGISNFLGVFTPHLILVFLLLASFLLSFSMVFWLAVWGGMLLELFSFFPPGIMLFTVFLSVIVCVALQRSLLVKNHILSLLIMVVCGTVFFNIVPSLLMSVVYFFNESSLNLGNVFMRVRLSLLVSIVVNMVIGAALFIYNSNYFKLRIER